MADATLPTPPTGSVSLSDLVSLTVDTIKAVEAAYPQGGAGKDKFDTVYNYVMTFAPLLSIGAQILQNLLPYFINTTVALFNKIGLFMHNVQAQVSAPAAPAAPASPAAPTA